MRPEVTGTEIDRNIFLVAVVCLIYFLKIRSSTLAKAKKTEMAKPSQFFGLGMFQEPAQKLLRKAAESISKQLESIESFIADFDDSLAQYAEKKAAHLVWRRDHLAELEKLKELFRRDVAQGGVVQDRTAGKMYSEHASFYVKEDTKQELAIAAELESCSQEIARLHSRVDRAKTLEELKSIPREIDAIHHRALKLSESLNSIWEQLGEEKRHFADENLARAAELERAML